MRYRTRLIATIIVLLVYFASQEPEIFIGAAIILIIGWFFIAKKLIPFLDISSNSSDIALRRKNALNIAKIYLLPYKSIWRNLKLANKFCSLTLDSDGVSIFCNEKIHPYRKFKVISSHVHKYTDLWDMFCIHFDSTKFYDDLVEDCRLYKVSIYEYAIKQETQTEDVLRTSPSSLLDINNCSEIELTALPGISIVMAKKAIKRRDEIGGFKTVEDFFLFMKLKSHMESQLRNRICVSKMKSGAKKIERSNERNVDL